MIFDPNLYPTVFLSYDEPNCEDNYRHLLTLCPTALRVHGIKGSDTAHKAVANLVDTERVIVVDGDNFVKPDFYKQKYELPDYSGKVVSFCTKNLVNGLEYGNGSIKSWPVDLLRNMRTHENTESTDTLVDFDFSNYLQTNVMGSFVAINSSPKQAWRAGFREGVKLLLNDGEFKYNFKYLDWRNYNRLWNWMHIGMDMPNGLWAIYGARYGCWKGLSHIDLSKLHDFDYLDNLFFELTYYLKEDRLIDECNRIGSYIRTLTNDRKIGNVYSVEDSKRYKEQVKPILRCPNNEPYDIVFVSYNEVNADKNYYELLKRFPRAKRIHGVKGIHNAHIEAAKLCSTDYFWVVDGDAEIVDDFNFDYVVPFFDVLRVRVWRAKNPVNNLVYGYGGVKLLPRVATIHMSTDRPDMTTSICNVYEPIFVVSNVTRFDTDPFNSWRSAFRECAKLASEVIDRQVSKETQERLEVWCTVGDNQYVIDGAKLGREYGQQNKNNLQALRKINDFQWMKEQYDRFYNNSV